MRRHSGSTFGSDLRAVPGFAGCSDRQLTMIDSACDRIVVPTGTVLFRQGNMERDLYIILSGTAVLTRDGRVLSTVGAGDYVGELAALVFGARNATLTAQSMCTALVVGPQVLSGLMTDIPSFRDVLLQGMARRLRQADDLLARTVEPWGTGSSMPLRRVPALTN